MDDSITPKGMIRDIYAQRNFVYQLLGKEIAYESLINVLLTYDDSVNYPTVSQVVRQLKISYSKFKRLITELYEDLCNIYENNIDYSIRENEYIFSLNWLGKYAQVKLQNLPVCPRVGEEIELPYFQEKVGTSFFYVKSILHTFRGLKQSILFDLAVGQYNVFWNYFRDEQYARGKMTLDEYNELSESKIRKKYGFRWI